MDTMKKAPRGSRMADAHPLVAQLRATRLSRGITQRAMAAAVGITPGGLAGFENGQRTPSLGVLTRWAAQLGKELTLTEPDGPFEFGVVVRSDGQAVQYRRQPGQIEPDLETRFEVFPARCGCYPLNTDDREFTCPHGAHWSRGLMEPFGRPTEKEA